MKLIFLLFLPGLLAGFLSEDIVGKKKIMGKIVAESFLFAYLLFLLDGTLLFAFYRGAYADLLEFAERNMQTVEDLYLFAVLWMVQVCMAAGLGCLARMVRFRSIEKAFIKMQNLQNKVAQNTIFATLVMTVLAFVAKDNAERQIYINEVCSKNDGVIADENGDYHDYIEIYNSSRWNISLKNFRVYDNPELTGGMRIDTAVPLTGLREEKRKDMVIGPGEYYLIWVNGDAYPPSTETGYEDIDFNLSDRGGTVYLTGSGKQIIDAITIPAMEPDMSYARATDGAEEWKAEVPTPLEPNNDKRKYLEEPVFSAESGFYENAFLLTIEGAEGEQIYYTLDGSDPDENAILYEGPITVENVSDQPSKYRSLPNVEEEYEEGVDPYEPLDKMFVIRAISMDLEGNKSDIVTRTYLVDMEQYKDSYVLSIVSDPDELFGEDGIYVTGKAYDEWYLGGQQGEMPELNYMKSGREAEIETSVALIKNSVLMEQQAGLRIQGASRRAWSLKRFSLFARREYSGSRYFEYNLFGEPMHSFFMRLDFEDAFIHSLVKDRRVGGLDAVPANVFVNGEFWYTTYLREKYSEDYVEMAYGVNREQVRIEEAIPGELYAWLDQHDLSKQEDYEGFCELIDVQSYMDYLATNIYMCNMDTSESKNCRMWKSTMGQGGGYDDGRWRWLIYDTDSLAWNSIPYYGAMRYDIDSFAQQKEYAGIAYNQEKMYLALRRNEDFCKQFVLTFMDLANVNFRAENVEKKLPAWGKDMSWNDGFFEKRFDGIVPALAKEFALTGTLEEICLDVNDRNAGTVQINTVTPDLAEGSFVGRYYTDYPVTITAIPKEGYRFVGWRVVKHRSPVDVSGAEDMASEDVAVEDMAQEDNTLVTEKQLQVSLAEGGCSYMAVFEKENR